MELKVNDSTSYVCVYFHKSKHLMGGSASASSADGESWFLNRAFVSEDLRGKGFGTQLVKKLLEVLANRKCKELMVTPGGYNSSIRRLNKFYKSCGFVPEKVEGCKVLMWRPKS